MDEQPVGEKEPSQLQDTESTPPPSPPPPPPPPPLPGKEDGAPDSKFK